MTYSSFTDEPDDAEGKHEDLGSPDPAGESPDSTVEIFRE
jgi:hypothetical protein